MTLKICSCCGRLQTTRTAIFLGRLDEMLWFNCESCRSTFVLRKVSKMMYPKKMAAPPGKPWFVARMDNLTAYDDFNEDTFEGPTNVEISRVWFADEQEAHIYYLRQKAMLRFAGGPGMYYTYPAKGDESEGEE